MAAVPVPQRHLSSLPRRTYCAFVGAGRQGSAWRRQHTCRTQLAGSLVHRCHQSLPGLEQLAQARRGLGARCRQLIEQPLGSGLQLGQLRAGQEKGGQRSGGVAAAAAAAAAAGLAEADLRSWGREGWPSTLLPSTPAAITCCWASHTVLNKSAMTLGGRQRSGAG